MKTSEAPGTTHGPPLLRCASLRSPSGERSTRRPIRTSERLNFGRSRPSFCSARGSERRLRAAASERATPSARIDVPLADLLGPLRGPRWLLEPAFRLALGDALLGQLVGVGMLGRLWSGDAAERRELTERLFRWASAIAAVEAELAEVTAVERAQALLACFHVAAHRGAAPGAVNDLANVRDDLDSVLFVLRLAGRGDVLAHILEEVDAEAAGHLAKLAEEFVPDRRTLTVAWQQPSAWWGTLAVVAQARALFGGKHSDAL